ncbi:PREDICTED: uncharacterized protein LOC104589656 [Nelumbo nucifera]|uniref:Uncharacterized protein LOC104589656 n=1 Tax=Nelumbo nucifera TaxID=4432 RepID=A0A1U7Z696_NELNU|nr:PREDICTED: uncharacterized protein LOC104589656 [Nelumbo nucifera]XP_010246452.1 PREDICTED: uncharacterized protein LOC104589656 [Nelumbo nucifera]XP_010246523.1 PREDICTED: uncharacterized protein LOC104589656 [Nelumbo nucifera]
MASQIINRSFYPCPPVADPVPSQINKYSLYPCPPVADLVPSQINKYSLYPCPPVACPIVSDISNSTEHYPCLSDADDMQTSYIVNDIEGYSCLYRGLSNLNITVPDNIQESISSISQGTLSNNYCPTTVHQLQESLHHLDAFGNLSIYEVGSSSSSDPSVAGDVGLAIQGASNVTMYAPSSFIAQSTTSLPSGANESRSTLPSSTTTICAATQDTELELS